MIQYMVKPVLVIVTDYLRYIVTYKTTYVLDK